MYDDEQRTKDADELRKMDVARLNITGPRVVFKSDPIVKALAVFVLDEQLRPTIEQMDPKAMEQAREALGLPS